MLKRLDQRGDTIIEVLIAIAIGSLILGITYSTMNRSLITGRRAQERSEALKLAESQLERIKSNVSQFGFTAAVPTKENTLYCMNVTTTDNTSVVTIPTPPGKFPPGNVFLDRLHDIDNDQFIDYHGAVVADKCSKGIYDTVSAVRNGLLSVIVRWDSLSRGVGDNRDQLVLVYKLNEI
jgi:prepilin-type N-terminal cleavage/methylation domain-containing protein